MHIEMLEGDRPGIDYRNRKIVEMRLVAGDQRRIGSKSYSGDHCVSQFYRASRFFSRSHEICGVFGSTDLETGNSPIKRFDH